MNRSPMRRCGRAYPTEVAALGSRKGRTGRYLAVPCRCAGWHLRGKTAATRTAERRLAAARPPAPKDTGPSQKVRGLVLARDNFQCVGCGKPVGGGFTWWSLQHRKARGQGGDNSPCNLVTLCGSATSPGCHRLCEDRDREAHERGLWLLSTEDPALVPVMVFSEDGSGATVWLLPDGTYGSGASGEAA